MDADNRRREWLEPDGLGGFASGTASGMRTRRYHALLLSATTPPTGRVVLVNGFDAWVRTESGNFALTSQQYLPSVRHPDGEDRIESFESDPWPRWRFRLPDGTVVIQEIVARHGRAVVALRIAVEPPSRATSLVIRPLLSGRDYHALHHENASFRFEPDARGELLRFRPYEGVPEISFLMNGSYRHDPAWYRSFLYLEERARGLDDVEDLASPGEMHFDLQNRDAIWILSSDPKALEAFEGRDAASLWQEISNEESRRRASFPTPLHRAADAYLVRRGGGSTIVAGYPWFTDWGRDTFIALRGVCLSTRRWHEAEGILLEWAGAVSEGMLPNRFPDRGEAPEFNSVDASLWYVIAVEDFLARAPRVDARTRRTLLEACQSILEGYSRGTRYRIHADSDGLLAAGEPGIQLTWMDAKVGDWVVTPRVGKPVEVEALWLNALAFGARFSKEWKSLQERGIASFEERFWSPEDGSLYDVVDVDHVAGTRDSSFRPNQIFAVGGLPRAVLFDRKKARSVVDAVERRLWTPMGLRSLAPEDPRYVRRYEGGVRERDGSYHQGTVWPWLAGAFVEAWVRVRSGRPAARQEARMRFLEPLLAASGGHVAEIADAEPPHTPRGCPFQAWSVGEALRASELLREPAARKPRKRPQPTSARTTRSARVPVVP